MGAIPGTNVAAVLAPFTTDDDYPTHDAQYGKGGWREVADITARDAIPVKRQTVGMVVFVQGDQAYQLTVVGTPPTWVPYSQNSVQLAAVRKMAFLEG